MLRLTHYLQKFSDKYLKVLILFCLFSFIMTSCNNTKVSKNEINEYLNIAEKYSEIYNLDTKFVTAVICAESSYDKNAVSKSGACGLMQIMPKTFEFVCENENEDIFDPETNIKYGCKYLRYLFDKFEIKETVLVAYNAGEGNTSKWLKNIKYSEDGKTFTAVPYSETANYVRKVMSTYEKIKND